MKQNSTREQYHCTAMWPANIPSRYSLHLVIVIVLVSAISVFFNSVLIYSLFKTKQLSSNINKLVLLMNLSDLINGIVVTPSFAVTLAVASSYQICILEQAILYGLYLFGYFSYFMLMCISRDRYHQIQRLTYSGSSMSNLQMKLVSVISFVLSHIMAFLGIKIHSFAFQVGICIINLCLLLTMFVVYSFLLKKVRGYQRRITVSIAKFVVGNGPMKFDTTVTKTIWMLFAALFVSYIPFNISTPLFSYALYEKGSQPSLALRLSTMWSYILAASYCGTNAVILGYGNGTIRRFVKRRIRQMIASEKQFTTTRIIQVSRNIEAGRKNEGLPMRKPSTFSIYQTNKECSIQKTKQLKYSLNYGNRAVKVCANTCAE